MMIKQNKIKILIGLILTAIFFNLFMPAISKAQDISAVIILYLQAILARVDQLPAYIKNLTDSDQTEATKNLKKSFVEFQNAHNEIINARNEGIVPLLSQNHFFGPVEAEKLLPNINALTFSTLVGKPYRPFNKGENEADFIKAYVTNASGMLINHPIPGQGWKGAREDQEIYRKYFNTIYAIQSYNAYVISELANSDQEKKYKEKEDALINLVDGDTWFQDVASENLNVLFRQILLFNSQMYVLMTRLLAIQKQILYAQVMNNTLAVLQNQTNEEQLLLNATRPRPPGT